MRTSSARCAAAKRTDLNAEIEEGAASTIIMHLANISYRAGRTIHFDEKTMTCIGDAEANKLLTRDYRKPYVVPKITGAGPHSHTSTGA